MKGEISEEWTERSVLITGNAQRRVSFNDKKKPALDEETNGMTDEKKAAFDEETNGMMAQSTLRRSWSQKKAAGIKR